MLSRHLAKSWLQVSQNWAHVRGVTALVGAGRTRDVGVRFYRAPKTPLYDIHGDQGLKPVPMLKDGTARFTDDESDMYDTDNEADLTVRQRVGSPYRDFRSQAHFLNRDATYRRLGEAEWEVPFDPNEDRGSDADSEDEVMTSPDEQSRMDEFYEHHVTERTNRDLARASTDENIKKAQELMDTFHEDLVPRAVPGPPGQGKFSNQFVDSMAEEVAPFKSWYPSVEDGVLLIEPDGDRGEFMHSTSITDPSGHASEHIGSFYSPSKDRHYLSDGSQKWFSFLDSRKVLLREAQIAIGESLDQHREELGKDGSMTRSGYLLTGPRGNGKSVSLDYLVDRAGASGWIVLHLPRAYNYTQHGMLTHWKEDLGVHSLPYEDTEISEAFLQMNKELFSSWELQLDSSKAFKGGCTTMAQLLSVSDTDTGSIEELSRGLYHALAEIRHAKDQPFLIAVDQWNAFHGATGYLDRGAKSYIDAYDLQLGRLCRDIMSGAETDFGNALVIGAPSYSVSRSVKAATSNLSDSATAVDNSFGLEEAVRMCDLLYHSKLVGKPIPLEQVRLEWHATNGDIEKIIERMSLQYHCQEAETSEEHNEFIEVRDYMLTQMQY